MAALHRLALDAHRDLAAEAGTAGLIRQNGTLTVYESARSFRAALGDREGQRQRGFEVEELSGDELRQLEPGLAPIFPHAVFFPGGAHTVDPGALTAGLAEAFSRGGGRILAAHVTGFDYADDRPAAVRTSKGRLAADGFVVAAGAWSAGLAEMLGERAVLESERGYHLTLADPGVDTRHPVSFYDRKFMATPMQMGLRLAGTAEFAGLDAPPNWKRVEPLRAHARKAFRDIRTEDGSPWMGNRPGHAGFAAGARRVGAAPQCLVRLRPRASGADGRADQRPAHRRPRGRTPARHRHGPLQHRPLLMLTDAQLDRYARHLILPEVGGAGQQKLLSSRVLAVGAGGLGAPLLLYLAAAGVGALGVIDDDEVDVSNLQRQVIHSADRIGGPRPRARQTASGRSIPPSASRPMPSG